MAKKYNNKYRRTSMRAKWWDYSWNGAYFITICTYKHQHFFGQVIHQEMQHFKLGELANQFWLDIPHHFPYVLLGNHIIMPDHMHGIIIIDKPYDGSYPKNSIKMLPPNRTGGLTGIKNPMFHENLGRIIRWYKGRTTFECRKIESNFTWHPLYYGHIILDKRAFQNISKYIENNPKKWKSS